MKKFPWVRCIIAIPALAALLIALSSGIEWKRLRFHRADARTAVIAELPNAFGSVGTVETDFNPKYGFTCKEMLLVEHTRPKHSENNYAEVLKGLQAHVEILKKDGTKEMEADITDKSFRPFWKNSEIDSVDPVFLFHPVYPGSYKLRITVTQPATLLARVPHKIKARYRLCGLEYFATTIIGIICIAASLLALILISIIIGITLGKRRRARQQINT